MGHWREDCIIILMNKMLPVPPCLLDRLFHFLDAALTCRLASAVAAAASSALHRSFNRSHQSRPV